MTVLHAIDWSIIGAYMLVTLALGLYFTRRAGTSMQSFFVSNRELHWLLSGISLIATSFASDTPLWITNLVRMHGVHYVWQYWAPAIGGALATVLFARLWRRSEVLTDIELFEIRYNGRAAAGLRLFSSVSTSLVLCPLIIGWVTKAMEIISRESLGLSEEYRIRTTILVLGWPCFPVPCRDFGVWFTLIFCNFFWPSLARPCWLISASSESAA